MYFFDVLSPLLIHLLMFGGGLGLAIGSLLWTFRNSKKIAITEFRLFLAVVVLWISTQIVELLGGPVTSYYASFLIRGLRGLMAFSWFYFTMTYAGYGDFVHSTAVRAVVGVATVFLILATGVPLIATEFIFPSVTTTTEPLVAVSLSGLTPFRRLTQTIGYSLVLIGTTGLTYRFLTTGYTKWWRVATVLAATLAVIILDFSFEKSESFLLGVDYAALGATVASVMLIAVLYRHELFASVPMGRDHLFRTLDQPVFVVDANQRIIDLNEAARNLCTSETQLGNRIDAVLPEETNTAEFVSTTDKHSVVEIDVADTTRYYELTRSEISPHSASRRAVVTLKDITEQRQRKQELKRQNERLERFVSVVSHDLRNPMEVVEARVECAQKECDSTHLTKAADGLDRMEALIEDLLTLAREGQRVGDTRPVALATISEECWGNVMTDTASLVIDTEQMIRADPSRLQELLANLIRNAIEHGDTDVTVTIGDLEDGFYVADDGPGIPEEEYSEIFELDYTTAEGGTGLGLTIVEDIVKAHGWEITVTDSDEGGARFEITDVEIVE